ncbi:MAG: hypothetical protein LBV54_06485, partial [Puniceicoccales bacterium]|nr:hypothetical protein [Puniceicoccales bacterium]
VLRRAAAAPFAQKFIALLKARKDDPQFKRPDPKTSPTRSKGQFLYSQNELELHIQKLEQLAGSL